jgi:hypothetical protein
MIITIITSLDKRMKLNASNNQLTFDQVFEELQENSIHSSLRVDRKIK